MTSQCKIDSNRRNARNSTGPTTGPGKKTVASNARRHGLMGTLTEGSPEAARAQAMVRIWLKGANHGPEIYRLMYACAEAQVKLDLIRRMRQQAIRDLFKQDARNTVEPALQGCDEADAEFILVKIPRYERVARAQRLEALKRLETLGIVV